MESETPFNLLSTPEQIKWIEKQEVLSLYNVTKRNLQYWRSTGTVNYSRVGKRTYYIESQIQELVEKRAIPKKRIRIVDSNEVRVRKKDRDIHPVVMGFLYAVAFTLPFISNLMRMKPIAPTAILTPVIFMLLMMGVYGLTLIRKRA